jgi:protein disulfide-isomerase A6
MNSVHLIISFSILTASNVLALYGPHSGVVDLNPNNFDHRVKDSDGIWIVEFFAPWCGHCQQVFNTTNRSKKA